MKGIQIFQNIVPHTAADTASLRQRIQHLPERIFTLSIHLITEYPDNHIFIRRNLLRFQQNSFCKPFPPVFHLLLSFLLYKGHLIVIGIHRHHRIEIGKGHAQHRRFSEISGIHHRNHKNSRRQKRQKMLAALCQLVHQKQGKQHCHKGKGKMQFNHKLIFQASVPLLRFRTLSLLTLQPFPPSYPAPVRQTLSQKHQHHHKITRKKRTGCQTCPEPLKGMSPEAFPHIVELSESIFQSSEKPLGKERLHPVGEKQRCKIFCPQIMLNHGIRSQRHRQNPHRTSRSLPTPLFCPEIHGKQQKQHQIGTHQRHDTA